VNTFRTTGAHNALITGGGAKNEYLISLLKSKSSIPLTLPDESTIDFKEALIFAFLGILFFEGIEGSLASVTGASSNSIAGVVSKGSKLNRS